MDPLQAAFIYSDALWQEGFGEDHPMKPERLKRTHDLLAAYGAFAPQNVRLVPPEPATRRELCLFHTPQYVDAVARMSKGEGLEEAGRYGFSPDETPVFPGMYPIEALKAGGALTAARLLMEEEMDVAFNVAGGLHHARADRAAGFCIFNDPAIAIHWLLQRGLRVAYVDIDAHHGDGVQEAFYDTDQVLTISLHQAGILFYPGTGFPDELGTGDGHGYTINVPFQVYTGDELYLWAFREIVPPLVRQFAPDVLVTQLGIDTHYRDPLPLLQLTTHGYAALVEHFRELAEEIGPWLALGGGGYALEVVPRAWTLAFGVMSGQTFANELPAAYAERYEPGALHDAERPAPPAENVQRKIRSYAQEVVSTLKSSTQAIWRWDDRSDD